VFYWLFLNSNLEENGYYTSQPSQPNNRSGRWPIGNVANQIDNASYYKTYRQKINSGLRYIVHPGNNYCSKKEW
jgi:hypothetical protein